MPRPSGAPGEQQIKTWSSSSATFTSELPAPSVVKITVLLARPEMAKEMNEAYAEFFPGQKPARAIARLGVEMAGVLVSIEAIATV